MGDSQGIGNRRHALRHASLNETRIPEPEPEPEPEPRNPEPRNYMSSAARWAGDLFVPSTINCPHAARMSRPRLLRTDTVMRAFAGIHAYLSTVSSDGGGKRITAA